MLSLVVLILFMDQQLIPWPHQTFKTEGDTNVQWCLVEPIVFRRGGGDKCDRVDDWRDNPLTFGYRK